MAAAVEGRHRHQASQERAVTAATAPPRLACRPSLQQQVCNDILLTEALDHRHAAAPPGFHNKNRLSDDARAARTKKRVEIIT